ncbi:MAG: ribonuclease HII [Firmicutes bacterium]|nr:ribonuclease HII [Bacillota bacterium]
MYEYEKELLHQGFLNICGVDEAGRGPLAGPVVAGAVILDPNVFIDGLNDSKQLSKKKRDYLAKEIKEKAKAYGIAFVNEKEIDKINIYQASKKAMLLAIEKCNITPDYILSDAMPLTEITIPSLPLIKGDTLSASIAAASILAKVTRDEFMEEMALKYPGYGFEKHKGYPTLIHMNALKLLGVSEIHRLSYAPIKRMIQEQLRLDL